MKVNDRLANVINNEISLENYHKIKGQNSVEKAKILIEKFVDRTIKKLLKQENK